MINLSFTHSRLLKHKSVSNVKPGVFEYEGDLAERWNQQDDTSYVQAPAGRQVARQGAAERP